MTIDSVQLLRQIHHSDNSYLSPVLPLGYIKPPRSMTVSLKYYLSVSIILLEVEFFMFIFELLKCCVGLLSRKFCVINH